MKTKSNVFFLTWICTNFSHNNNYLNTLVSLCLCHTSKTSQTTRSCLNLLPCFKLVPVPCPSPSLFQLCPSCFTIWPRFLVPSFSHSSPSPPISCLCHSARLRCLLARWQLRRTAARTAGDTDFRKSGIRGVEIAVQWLFMWKMWSQGCRKNQPWFPDSKIRSAKST